MSDVKGVGRFKLYKYGPSFLRIIEEYKQEGR